MTSHATSNPDAKQAESSDSPAAEEIASSKRDAQLVEDHNSAAKQATEGSLAGDEPDKSERETSEASTKDEGEVEESDEATDAPPLPNESLPPLPAEAPPAAAPDEDDGWAPVWDQSVQAFYFYNRFTGATQWTNPRVPDVTTTSPPGVEPAAAPVLTTEASGSRPVAGGYDPAIHGDYDPTAWYAQPAESTTPPPSTSGSTPAELYAATGAFNRFTGRWQAADLNPENYNDENKSKRQMNAFFDVDAAANSHDGRSLKAERSGKKLSKSELKQFKEKRKAKKEEKRRAWLRD